MDSVLWEGYIVWKRHPILTQLIVHAMVKLEDVPENAEIEPIRGFESPK